MSDFILTQTGEQLQNTLDNAATTSSVEAVANTAQTNSSDIDTIESKIPSEASSSNQLADKSHVESAVSSEETRAKAAEEANENAIDAIEQKIPSEATSSNQLADKAHVASAVSDEETRARAAEQANANDIDAIEGKIPTEASSSNQLADKAHVANAVASEASRAQLAEQANASDIDTIEGKIPSDASSSNKLADKAYVNAADTTLQGNITAEETRARAAEQANANDIDAIEALIPSQATTSNQLADKDYVNSSISTSTAEFRGTYNSLNDLRGVTADENDYGFVRETDSDGNTIYNRYKYTTANGWTFEYALNNSSFTAAQWAAIESGITSGDKTKLDALPTRTQLDALLAAKQATLTFDTTPTANSNNPVYSGGVKAALDGKQASLTFDNAPTANSGNPVKSGGVYAADATLQANINSEASTRATAVGTLTTNLNAEITRAQGAEQTNATNIAKVTGAETVTSIPDDWYMMMSNGNGTAFKKALDTYIEQRVVEKIGALITNTDLSTNITKVLGLNSSNALGVNSISTLASVLGAMAKKYQLAADYNEDDLKETGFYLSNDGGDFYIVYKWSDTLIFQQKIQNQAIYNRVYWYGSGWASWRLNYDHNLLSNSTELSSLASALGGTQRVEWGADTDISTITDGVSYIDIMGKVITELSQLGLFGGGISFVYSTSSTYHVGIQIIATNNVCAMRSISGAAWGGWRVLWQVQS